MENNEMLKTVSLKEILKKDKERYIKMVEMLKPLRELLEKKGISVLDMYFTESINYDIALLIRFSILWGDNILMINKNLNDTNYGIASDRVCSLSEIFDNSDLKLLDDIMNEAIECEYGREDKVYNLSKKYVVNASNNYLGIYGIDNGQIDEPYLTVELDYDDSKSKEDAIINSNNPVMDKTLRKKRGLNLFLENIKVDEKQLRKKYRK